MRAFVTGAAGFIGSNLVDRLVSAGHAVVGVDNFSSGQRRFLKSAGEQARFAFVEMDLLDRRAVTAAMAGCDIVFHLAANADVRFGTNHTFKDIEQNVIVTYNVLEAMRSTGTRKIAFLLPVRSMGKQQFSQLLKMLPFRCKRLCTEPQK